MAGRKKPVRDPEHIKDLVPDPRNARKHNPRNIGEIADSLSAVGAARSIVIDEDNVVLAGNGLIEAAAERGITKLKVIEADGETIVAVRRRGLTAAKKAELAIRDNRAGESASWDAPVLVGLMDEFDLDPGALGFRDQELQDLVVSSPGPDGSAAGAGDERGEGPDSAEFYVLAKCKNASEQLDALNALRAIGIEVAAK